MMPTTSVLPPIKDGNDDASVRAAVRTLERLAYRTFLSGACVLCALVFGLFVLRVDPQIGLGAIALAAASFLLCAQSRYALARYRRSRRGTWSDVDQLTVWQVGMDKMFRVITNEAFPWIALALIVFSFFIALLMLHS
jgi:hypothetical protein